VVILGVAGPCAEGTVVHVCKMAYRNRRLRSQSND
jgi:hypothetical protein